MEEQVKVGIRKNNMKLYPIYRSLSVDIVFLYAIKLLFLTQIKEITVSNIIIAESFFAFFMILLQVPAVIFIKKMGKRNCAIITNLLNAQYIAIIIFSTSLTHLIIAEFVSALSFSVKNISDPNLLNLSIPKTEKRGEIFSKIEGKGISRYYYIDGVAAVIAGFLYAIDPYFPFIASMCVAIIAAIIALNFKEIKEEKVKAQEKSFKTYRKDLRDGFSYIFGSARLKYLLAYTGIMWGLFCLMTTYRTSLLNDMQVSSQMIGIIVAILGFASGIGSRIQIKVHRKFRKKTLTYLALTAIISMILSGIIVLLKLPYLFSLICVILLFIVMKTDAGIYSVLTKRYLGNFADSRIIDKIYSAEGIISNLFRIIIGLFGAWIISRTETALAMVIVGGVFVAVMVKLLFYMKAKVGLKPEQYKESEVKFKE